MIHPFMPFLTEELWQRLPRRPDDTTPSIVRAAYPQYDADLYDPESEAGYEVLLGGAKGIRSLISEYAIKDAAKGMSPALVNGKSPNVSEVFIQASSDASYKIASDGTQDIRALAGKGEYSISILAPKDPLPTGCAVFGVSADLAVFLEVKGRINPDTEITKAQTKMKKASDAAQKLRKVIDAPDFAEKSSEAVQQTERQRLADFEAEQRNYERSIEQFQQLKLEDK